MPELPAESGSVGSRVVIQVLTAILPGLNVSINVSTNSGSTLITLVKDGRPEVYSLPAVVPRRMLSRLANKYGVKPEYFYHPEMCSRGTATKQ